MKTTIIFFITLSIIGQCYSEDTIKLTVSADKPALVLIKNGTVVKNDGGFSLGASTILSIKNDITDFAPVVVFRSQPGHPLFRFEFGTTATALPLGERNFTIAGDGTIAGFGPGKKFMIPVIIECKKAAIAVPFWTDSIRTVNDPAAAHGSPASTNNNNSDPQKLFYLTKVPVFDAFTLVNYRSTSQRGYLDILNYYFFGDNPITLEDLPNINTRKEIIANPFIKDFFKTHLDAIINDPLWPKDAQATGVSDYLSNFSLSSIGGLDVTNIADGIAKFLVKRTKEELSLAFFDKLKKVIESSKDMQSLFPQTSHLLEAIGDNIYDYEKYIQNLREAFKEDVNSLPKDLPGIVKNHDAYFTAHKELKASLLSAAYIANAVETDQHPGDILENFPVEDLDDLVDLKGAKGAIQVLQLISASLRDTTGSDSSSYWVSIKKVRELVSNKDVFNVYLGLLYQQAQTQHDKIQFTNNFSFIDLLDKLAAEKNNTNISAYKNYIQQFAVKLDAMNKMIKAHNKPTNDSLALELYAKYFRATVDMIEYCTSGSDLPKFDTTKTGNLHVTLKPYFDIAYSLTDMTMDINRKNYSAAINQLVYIYNELLVKKRKQDSGLDSAKNSLSNLVKYGAFMASVSTAKNSDEIASAIETFALPAGSSRIKRESVFNISLNAYTGLYTGYEKIHGIDNNGFRFNAYGITAPIGVAFSFGHSLFFLRTGKENWKKGIRGWSSSVFFSLIDVGAVAAFRFNNDTTVIQNTSGKDTLTAAQAPAIQLKNIISPGMFISIGIPKSPLSVNIGAQVGPTLRNISSSNNSSKLDFSNSTYWRYSISLCVDLPLLNIYTKSK